MNASTDSLFPPTGITKLPKYAELRKRFFKGDHQYMMICSASCNAENTIFKMQLMSPDARDQTQFTKLESELVLPASDFKKIMKHLEHQDIMPVTLSLKRVKNIYTLLQYLLMSFASIMFLEDGRKDIAIYPKPFSILNDFSSELPVIQFMDHSFVISFHNIMWNTFRIVLTNPEDVVNVIKIDVDFDDTTLEHWFTKYGTANTPLGTIKNSIGILEGDDGELTASKKSSAFLPSCDGEELCSFKIVHNGLIERLTSAIKEVETYLKTIGVNSLSHFGEDSEIKYYKLKFSNQMQKASLHFVWDRPEKQLLEVKITNFFETFAPNNQKVKACGEFTFVYDAVWKHFERKYPELDRDDKLAVLSLVSEGFSLSVFEKELTKQDEDKYKTNPITCQLK